MNCGKVLSRILLNVILDYITRIERKGGNVCKRKLDMQPGVANAAVRQTVGQFGLGAVRARCI